MSTLKKVLVAAAILAGCAVQASTLYWQVAEQSEPFTFAALYRTDAPGTEGQLLGTQLATGATGYTADSPTGTSAAPTSTEIGDGTSGYFYVELVNYANGTVTSANKDYPWSYNELVSSGYISTGAEAGLPTGIAAGGLDGGSVPEPTSGMLLLMGGALLALRRRRV